MTNDNVTVINTDDLFALFDLVEKIRNTGLACSAFQEILQPSVRLHPLIYLVFNTVDEQTAELIDLIDQLKYSKNITQ